MQQYGVRLYKQIPALRLLAPIIIGIIYQFYADMQMITILLLFAGSVFFLCGFLLLPIVKRFALGWLKGILINSLFFAVGAMLAFVNNGRHKPQFIGNYYQTNLPVLVTLQEPLIAKPKSYKAQARAEAVLLNGKWQTVSGNMLLYFKKSGIKPKLGYGNQLIINKALVPISNSGNPGGFDYRQYCGFQNTYYQVFLADGNYQLLTTSHTFFFDQWLIDTRLAILSILRNNIKSADELAVAEALLIGYRDDLDRDLVQAYSNTGVVHIIAISGLHLGMIYGLLLLLFRPI